ncbi:MAG: SH3 domain-containing protein [Chloroflexi bacterium]|nr:SH3 domain-containing protein [Chloroflexota bacterium]
MKRLISLAMSLVFITLSVLVAQPAAAASPAQAASFWTGDYFNNAYLSGAAIVSRQDQSIAFNWGTGSPAAGIPSDNFSARWGSNPYFTAGTYRFTATADDAIGLTIDFQNSVFNTIASPRPGQTLTADYVMSEGVHHLQLDYQEFSGDAYVYLSWTQISGNPGNPGQPVVPSAIVMTNELNVRSGPGTSYPVVTKVYQGQNVTLNGRNYASTWVSISGYNFNGGWVNVNYVQPNVAISSLPVLDSTPAPAPGILTVTVNTGALNIRSGPASYFAIATSVPRGGSMYATGRNADTTWVQVQLSNGLQGWVNAKYIIANGNLYNLPITSGGSTTPPPSTRTYVVQPGDNLYRISLKFGVSMASIAAANNIYNYNQIYVGQVLIIPAA